MRRQKTFLTMSCMST